MPMKGISIPVLLIALLAHMPMPRPAQGQERANAQCGCITVGDGLSHRDVSYSLQAAQGFMWFGSKYDVNLYDGLWHQVGRSIDLLILRPWWETRLFKGLILLTGLLMGVSIVIYVRKLRSEIKHRKRMQGQLEESEGQIRLLLENMGDMVSRHNPDSSITYVSPSCENLLGYRADELRNISAGETVHPEDRETTFDTINEAIKQRDTHYLVQHRLRHKQGHYVWVETVGRLIFDPEGDLHEIQCNVRDISKRKQAEDTILKSREQLRSLASRLSSTEEAIRRKAATILHDSIGQSLVSCQLLLGVEKSADLAPHLKSTFNKVIDILDHVTEETKELTFDLASPTLYKLGLISALDEWLTETIQSRYPVQTHLGNHGVPASLDETVSVMAFRSIREISFNAVKHAQAHRIEVCLRMKGNELTVTVLDDGRGFDYKKIEKTAIRKGQFGLFSIKESLEYMGGQFQVETAPACGTRVIFTLPVPADNTEDSNCKNGHTLVDRSCEGSHEA